MLKRFRLWSRIAAKAPGPLLDAERPVLVHLIVTRRCNLDCSYCNEYDQGSRPVPAEVLAERVDRLAALRTVAVTLSGGEPLLHPQLEDVVARIASRRMIATLISNGYLLSRERIESLNRAGLDHLEISVDNVEPDAVSRKSLRLLEPKLRWLAEHARFSVAINSVVGSGVARPEDALAIARRARELGFMSSVGIVHDGTGQLQPLRLREMEVYRELRRMEGGLLGRINGSFQANLAQGRPNAWRCRAGARYLYVDEDGLVHYCSQQRGTPGIPLAAYTREHIRRELRTPKACAPYCTINCVQQISMIDAWRIPQTAAAEPRPEGAGATPEAAREGAAG
jgi:MoaA/NifB/PqqE/SkfB family radical SAM enzyme